MVTIGNRLVYVPLLRCVRIELRSSFRMCMPRWPNIAASALPHYDETMSFSETIFLFVLALVIFGPKKLPEIARQAGRLLAELRRASNEFKSQIETEISHLEVEKKQTILPPSAPPQGAVASLSLNPGSAEVVSHESSATLAAPADATLAGDLPTSNLAAANVVAENSDIPPASPAPVVSEAEVASTTQDSHV
jgi:sec-independent protein translocase protein TatB